jgi:hypothetical protein
MNGSIEKRIGNVTLCCISAEAVDLLDRIITAWECHKTQLPETLTCGDETWNPRESVYGFAYWLVRYSGLIEPAKSSTNQAGDRKGNE